MATDRILNEQIIEAQQNPLILAKRYVTLFKSGDTTPSVMNVEYAKAAGVAVNVTNFDMGQEAQQINILGDGFLTVVNGGDIHTNTGANKLLDSGEVYRFTRIDGIWYEDSLDGSAPASDVYTKTDADARFVNVAGDTMTGNLLFSPDNTVNIGAVGNRVKNLVLGGLATLQQLIVGGGGVTPSTLAVQSVLQEGSTPSATTRFDHRAVANAGSVTWTTVKSRGTLSAPGASVNNDSLFSWAINGHDGTIPALGASLAFTQIGAIASNSTPTRMRLTLIGTDLSFRGRWEWSNDDMYPVNDNQGNIGTATKRFKQLHLMGDVEMYTIGSGVIQKSPDGTRWRLTVDNTGVGSFVAA